MHEQKTNWPVFHMLMKCPGFRSYERTENGHFEYVNRACHDSRYSTVTLVHGEFSIALSVCDHVKNSAMGFSCTEEIGDFLSSHYDNLRHRKNLSAVFAVKRGFSHEYAWAYSASGLCDNCKEPPSEDIGYLKTVSEFMPKHVGPYGIHNSASWKGRFCSVMCAASFVGAKCGTCGTLNENTLSNALFSYSQEICDRAGVPHAWLCQVFCSRQCCSLALDGYLRNEREERNRKNDLKCVLEVKKVLSKAKSALQKRESQEVLQSLKKAFAQAASSH